MYKCDKKVGSKVNCI